MQTSEIEKDPNRIDELLQEGPQNIQTVVTAVAAKAAFYRGHNDVGEQTAMHPAGGADPAPAGRWEGGGYPDGPKGEAIPYLARVLAVADTYAALVSDWLGRQAVSLTEARAGLRAGAGTQFDPA